MKSQKTKTKIMFALLLIITLHCCVFTPIKAFQNRQIQLLRKGRLQNFHNNAMRTYIDKMKNCALRGYIINGYADKKGILGEKSGGGQIIIADKITHLLQVKLPYDYTYRIPYKANDINIHVVILGNDAHNVQDDTRLFVSYNYKLEENVYLEGSLPMKTYEEVFSTFDNIPQSIYDEINATCISLVEEIVA